MSTSAVKFAKPLSCPSNLNSARIKTIYVAWQALPLQTHKTCAPSTGYMLPQTHTWKKKNMLQLPVLKTMSWWDCYMWCKFALRRMGLLCTACQKQGFLRLQVSSLSRCWIWKKRGKKNLPSVMLTDMEKALAFCTYVIFMHSLLPKLAKQLSAAKAEREICLSHPCHCGKNVVLPYSPNTIWAIIYFVPNARTLWVVTAFCPQFV